MRLLTTKDANAALEELQAAAADLLAELDRDIPPALRGRESAVQGYVRAWKRLARRCLDLAHDARPDLVALTEGGELVLGEFKRAGTLVDESLFDYLAVNAPFSPWVGRFGAGRGAAVYLLSELRQAVPGLDPIPSLKGGAGLPGWSLDPEGFSRFARLVWRALAEGEPLLERIADVLKLTQTDLGRLFGVRRQAVTQWHEEGIPPARLPKALVVAQIADLLERNLMPARIPAIFRTPARMYADRSMLDMIAEDRHGELLDGVRASFDWAAGA